MRRKKSREPRKPEDDDLWTRIKWTAIALVLIGFGIYGLSEHELSVRPPRRYRWLSGDQGERQLIEFYGDAAVVLSIGFLVLSLAIFAEIAARSVEPARKQFYRKTALYLAMPGIAVVILAMTHR